MGLNKQKNQQHETTQKKRNQPHTNLTFMEHVYELRSRLFWVVFALMVASAAGFQYKDQLINLVMAPLHGQKLIYLTPGGGFSFIFTISIYFGALLCIPIAVYHLFRFMEPLLGGTSRKLVALFIFISAFLAAAGAAFGYFVTVPAAIDFLATFAGTAVVPSLTAESYLSFVVTYIFGLAVLFQIPLLLFIIDYVRPLPPKALLASQRYVIIGATVMAAIITPTPDMVNMAIVAMPIVAVYELGALAVFIRHKIIKGNRIARRQHIFDNDAPLTAIIEELEQPRVAAETPQYDADEIDPEFLFEDEIVQEQKPVVATPVSAQAKPQVPRSVAVDGFVRSGSARTIVRPPARQTSPSRMPQRPTVTRPARSVDGFSMMSRA